MIAAGIKQLIARLETVVKTLEMSQILGVPPMEPYCETK